MIEMLGFAYLILLGIIFFFVFASIFFLTDSFIKNRNRRIAIGMLVGLIVCAGILLETMF